MRTTISLPLKKWLPLALLACGFSAHGSPSLSRIPQRFPPGSVTDTNGPSSGPGPLISISGSWEGLASDFTLEPPDPGGAAGPNGIIQVVNDRVAYWDKAGNAIWPPVQQQTFFGQPLSAFMADAHALYDPVATRFYIVTLEIDFNNSHSYLDIAVSKTSDPRSSSQNDWFLYRFENTRTNGNNVYWGDYPGFGFDSQAIYVSVNLFSFTNFNVGDVQIGVFDKSALLNGTASSAFVFTTGGFAGAFTLQPITPIGTGPANITYFAEAPFLSSTSLRLWALTDPLGARTLTSTLITIPDNGGSAPFQGAPQPGTSVTIDPSDVRAQGNAFWFNGSIWFCHTAGGNTDNKAVVHYYRIDVNGYPSGVPTLAEAGAIDGGPGEWTYQPSIGGNRLGDVCMVFCQSSLTRFPTIFATTRKAGAIAFETPLAVKTSPNYYFGGRWGDFGSVTADPVDDSFWVTHEWAKGTSFANWGTWWANVQPRIAPDFSIATNYITGGNGNSLIDTNECNDLYLVLTNIGSLGATNIEATITTTNQGVVIVGRTAHYPNLPISAGGTNLTPYKISTSPLFICGTPIDFTMVIKSDQNIVTNRLRLTSGLPSPTVRFDNNTTVPIPDSGETNSIIVVSNFVSGIRKVTVSLYIDHTFDQDLVLQLISPGGITNTLSANNGTSGDNYGIACSPDIQRTLFDDNAPGPISAGIPPFVGGYKPDQPLSVFIGTAGTNVNGIWKLRIQDQAAFDVGTLHCWSLFLTPALCTDGGGECPGADLAIGLSSAPEPVIKLDNLIYTISVTNNGPSTAKNVVASQVLPGSVVFSSASSSQGNASYSGGVVTAILGTIIPGATATVTVNVIPTAEGTISSSATVTSNQPDFDTSNNNVTLLSHVSPATADLSVAISDEPDPVTVGGSLAYTVTVTNKGPSTATGLTVTNLLPSSVAFISATVSQGSVSSYSNNVVVFVFGTLTNGARATGTVNVIPTAEGTITATAIATANQLDPISGNNTATATTAVGPAADLAITLTDSPDPVVLRSNLTYTIAVTNRGPSAASSVVVNSIVASSVIIVSTNTSQGFITVQSNNVTANLGTLQSGASAVITIVVSPTSLGPISATASISSAQPDPNSTNNTASVTTQVATPFVSIVASGATLTAESFSPPNGAVDNGETVTVSLRLRNAGNVRNTNLIATLLATPGVTPISPNPPQTYGVLAPSGFPIGRSFGFTASGTNGATIVATLQLQDGPNNLGTVSYSFTLPLVYTFANSSPINIRDNTSAVPYPSTISVSGLNGVVGRVTATLSNISHTFPQDIDVLLVGAGGQDSILMSGAGAPPLDNAVVTFDDSAPSPVPDGNSQILSTSYRPASYTSGINLPEPAPLGPYPAAMSAFNAANPNGTWSLFVADHTEGDVGNIANGWKLAITLISPVNQLADLVLSGGAAPSPATAGSGLSYTFTITNAGPNNATFLAFTNLLPAGVTLLSATSSQGSVVTNAASVVGNLGGLNLGASATVTITVLPSASAAGLLTNTANVASSETDLNSANNSASVVTTVNLPLADVGLTLSQPTNPIVIGSYLTNTISITNRGPGNALDLALTNRLPAGFNFVAATSTLGAPAYNSGTVTCQFGTLAPNAGATVTVVVTPVVLGTFTNTASLSTRSSDSNLADNSASSVISIVGPSPKIVAAGAVLTSESGPANGAIDPGETVTLALGLRNDGSADATNLTATLQNSGGVTPAGPAQKSYGRLNHGGPAATNSFTFVASGTNGGTIVATLALDDAGNSLGSVNFAFSLPVTGSFSNTTAITIPDHGAGAPYPSTIAVSGLTGLVSKATVTLYGLTHSFPRDINALLVSPAGGKALLVSHVGGGHAVTNITLTLDDAAASSLPNGGQLTSGTFKPTAYGTVAFPSPAPAAGYTAALAAVNGGAPNGTWSLYIFDDSNGDAGSIAGGWSLDVTAVTTINPVTDLLIAMTSAPASLYVGGVVTNVITVTNLGPASANSIIMTLALADGENFVSASLSQGSIISSSGGFVTVNFGALAVGASARATVVVAPSIAGQVINTATVSSSETDLATANNSVQTTITAISPLPPILTAGLTTNSLLQIIVTAEPNFSYVLQASSNLVSWVPVSTNTALGGSFKYVDSNTPAFKYRFYRAVRRIP